MDKFSARGSSAVACNRRAGVTFIPPSVVDRDFLTFGDESVGKENQLLILRITVAIVDEPNARVRFTRMINKSRQVSVHESVDGVVVIIFSSLEV